jgi:hypothetical protein
MKHKRIVRPFQVLYFCWGHGNWKFAKRPDARGSCELLQEAYANAARHLGRGSIYFKAVIIDREQERILAVLTRTMGQIKIEER